MIKLSLCIPTYNRGRFIGETIESIIGQATDEVEIVVSDNGSDDNTEELIRAYQEQFPRIRYFRWDSNVGADRNFLKVIELATGDYCWFMGSDDRVEPGGICLVIDELKTYPGLAGMTVGASGWNVDFTREVQLPRYIPQGKQLFTSSLDIVSNLGCYFGYLSGLVICRERWLSAVVRLSDRGTLYLYPAYAHVQVVLEMLEEQPFWLSIDHPVVQYRSANDSFSGAGILQRFILDIVGHTSLVGDCYGRSSDQFRSCADLACRTWHRARLNDAKQHALSVRSYFNALKISFPVYWKIPSYWVLVVSALVPRRIFGLMRKLKERW